MKKRIGWADPKSTLGEPRAQMVVGFTYLFAEEKHVMAPFRRSGMSRAKLSRSLNIMSVAISHWSMHQ